MKTVSLGQVGREELALPPRVQEALGELEKENARLKRIVGEQALDIDMLREVSRGNF